MTEGPDEDATNRHIEEFPDASEREVREPSDEHSTSSAQEQVLTTINRESSPPLEQEQQQDITCVSPTDKQELPEHRAETVLHADDCSQSTSIDAQLEAHGAKEEPEAVVYSEENLSVEKAAVTTHDQFLGSDETLDDLQQADSLVMESQNSGHEAASGEGVLEEPETTAHVTAAVPDHGETTQHVTEDDQDTQPEAAAAAASVLVPSGAQAESNSMNPTEGEVDQAETDSGNNQRETEHGNHQGTGETHLWTPEDDSSFLESSLKNQQAEKEALMKLVNDKVTITKKYEELRVRCVALEDDNGQRKAEVSRLTEKVHAQEQHILALEDKQRRLLEFEEWGKDNEAKVKDLQNRLATLAREDAEKDHHIQQLQRVLKEANAKLAAAGAEKPAIPGNQAEPGATPLRQSKVCRIM